MAKIPRIQFKRTKNPGVRPSKDNLAEGELAINLADRMLFTKSGEEIIDLGFAKGGTVNGDIIQETGNFTTNGVLTVQSPINPGINFLKTDTNEYLRLETKNNEGLFIFGDGGQAKAFVKLPKETGTIATREHVGKMVSTNDGETKLRAPNQTNLLIAKDNKELVWYDGSTNNRMVNFGAGGLDLAHKGSDAVGVSLYKKDGNQVRIETHAHSSSLMLAFAYKDSAGNNSYVINMPKENGVLASQQWVDGKYYKRLDQPSFKTAVNIYHSTTGSYAQLSYEDNGEVRWNINNNGSWIRLLHPRENGTIATREWTNTLVNRTGADTYIQSADGKHRLTIVNDGMFSVWHNDTKQRSFYVETGGVAVAAHSVRAPGIMATRGASELIKLGFNATGSPFLSYYDANGKWTPYYFPSGTQGNVSTQEWVASNFYKKTETYNKSEIDGKVNGRLTQAQGDARYPLKGDVYTKGESDGRFMAKGSVTGTKLGPLKTARRVNTAGTPKLTGADIYNAIDAVPDNSVLCGLRSYYSAGNYLEAQYREILS